MSLPPITDSFVTVTATVTVAVNVAQPTLPSGRQHQICSSGDQSGYRHDVCHELGPSVAVSDLLPDTMDVVLEHGTETCEEAAPPSLNCFSQPVCCGPDVRVSGETLAMSTVSAASGLSPMAQAAAHPFPDSGLTPLVPLSSSAADLRLDPFDSPADFGNRPFDTSLYAITTPNCGAYECYEDPGYFNVQAEASGTAYGVQNAVDCGWFSAMLPCAQNYPSGDASTHFHAPCKADTSEETARNETFANQEALCSGLGVTPCEYSSSHVQPTFWQYQNCRPAGNFQHEEANMWSEAVHDNRDALNQHRPTVTAPSASRFYDLREEANDTANETPVAEFDMENGSKTIQMSSGRDDVEGNLPASESCISQRSVHWNSCSRVQYSCPSFVNNHQSEGAPELGKFSSIASDSTLDAIPRSSLYCNSEGDVIWNTPYPSDPASQTSEEQSESFLAGWPSEERISHSSTTAGNLFQREFSAAFCGLSKWQETDVDENIHLNHFPLQNAFQSHGAEDAKKADRDSSIQSVYYPPERIYTDKASEMSNWADLHRPTRARRKTGRNCKRLEALSGKAKNRQSSENAKSGKTTKAENKQQCSVSTKALSTSPPPPPPNNLGKQPYHCRRKHLSQSLDEQMKETDNAFSLPSECIHSPWEIVPLATFYDKTSAARFQTPLSISTAPHQTLSSPASSGLSAQMVMTSRETFNSTTTTRLPGTELQTSKTIQPETSGNHPQQTGRCSGRLRQDYSKQDAISPAFGFSEANSGVAASAASLSLGPKPWLLTSGLPCASSEGSADFYSSRSLTAARANLAPDARLAPARASSDSGRSDAEESTTLPPLHSESSSCSSPGSSSTPSSSLIDVDHLLCSGVTVAGFKPRPIIRKRKKVMIPSTSKDGEYWSKRRKNNDSAKRSREAKKQKEKNFYRRALELEYENYFLKERLLQIEAQLQAAMDSSVEGGGVMGGCCGGGGEGGGGGGSRDSGMLGVHPGVGQCLASISPV